MAQAGGSGTGGALPQQRIPHVVSLKVLRAARPTLARNGKNNVVPYVDVDQPEYGQAFRQLYEGKASDPFEPLSSFFLLPSAFGSIYLGETFTAILSLSNDTDDGQIALTPVMKVELHTFAQNQPQQPTNKYQLHTVSHQALAPGQSVEAVVSHEIKDLAGHALVCTVTYGVKNTSTGQTTSRSFRKVYKFAVANPLSVRTKAHSPSSECATSTLSPSERNKVFLELQLQPQSESSMFFEKLTFLPVDGYKVIDVNPPQYSRELLPPQCTRQHLYILQPDPSDREVNLVPGSNQALGKLDIVWRTANGELGRLQTSMLGRKVPFAVMTPASVASPSKATPAGSTPPPPASRLSQELVTGTNNNTNSSPRPYVRQSNPVTLAPPTPSSQVPVLSPAAAAYDLVVTRIEPAERQSIERPFELYFRLRVNRDQQQRKFSVVYVAQSTRRLDNRTAATAQVATPDLLYLGPSTLPLEEKGEQAVYEWTMSFVAFEVGLFALGGLRLVDLVEVRIEREWSSVGEVWIGDA